MPVSPHWSTRPPSAVDMFCTPRTRPLARFWIRRAPLGTNRHWLSGVPLSGSCTACAPWAVEPLRMPSSLPVCTLRSLCVPSPASTTRPAVVGGAVVGPLQDAGVVGGGHVLHAEHLAAVDVAQPHAVPSTMSSQSWSAVPLSAHCSARPPSAVDMFWMPSTRPLAALTRRKLARAGAAALAAGVPVDGVVVAVGVVERAEVDRRAVGGGGERQRGGAGAGDRRGGQRGQRRTAWCCRSCRTARPGRR